MAARAVDLISFYGQSQSISHTLKAGVSKALTSSEFQYLSTPLLTNYSSSSYPALLSLSHSLFVFFLPSSFLPVFLRLFILYLSFFLSIYFTFFLSTSLTSFSYFFPLSLLNFRSATISLLLSISVSIHLTLCYSLSLCSDFLSFFFLYLFIFSLSLSLCSCLSLLLSTPYHFLHSRVEEEASHPALDPKRPTEQRTLQPIRTCNPPQNSSPQ